jgi:hypothetical protein
MEINLSLLPHTWLIDIDGTILKHNGHKTGVDELLSGVLQFWNEIPLDDTIILMSARTEDERQSTLDFLINKGLRFDHVIFGLPTGERVLINDKKPKGLETAIAVNIERDIGLIGCQIVIDKSL